jgi:hypothetical protein
MDALLVTAAIGAAIWTGFSVSAAKLSAAVGLAFGVAFLVLALVLNGTQCEGASISDILLLRNVAGSVYCSRGFTFLAYAFLIGALIVFLRAAFLKQTPRA